MGYSVVYEKAHYNNQLGGLERTTVFAAMPGINR